MVACHIEAGHIFSRLMMRLTSGTSQAEMRAVLEHGRAEERDAVTVLFRR